MAVTGANTLCVSILGVETLFFYVATLHGAAFHVVAVLFIALFPLVA